MIDPSKWPVVTAILSKPIPEDSHTIGLAEGSTLTVTGAVTPEDADGLREWETQRP